MNFKFYGTKKIPKEKAATFGYKGFETKNIKDVVKYVNTHAILPCSVEDGHRLRNNVEEIYSWIRLDVDIKGEAKKIDKALKDLMYIKKPSTSHKKNPYKWHYLIPIKNVSQNYDAYKLQYHKFLADHKIDLRDKSLASVVQNTNPMGEDGVKLTVVNKGEVWEAPTMKAPKRKKLTEKHPDMSKREVKKLLSKLTNHVERDKRGDRIGGAEGLGYTEFLSIGMALYDWCPVKGYTLYKKWAEKTGSYYAGDVDIKWNDFEKNASGDVTIGTLMYLVHGERPPEDEFKDMRTKKEKKQKVKEKKKGITLDALPGMLNEKLIKARGDQISLFDGVLTQSMHTFIYGAAGSNKTTSIAWIMLDVLKRYKNKKVHFWSFDASQNHEQAIYDYANHIGIGSDRFMLSVVSTSEDFYNYYKAIIDAEIDMHDIIIVTDTFKFISKNINDKNANKNALHFIKDLQALGATAITLGHTNKDGIKQSGTAEIEQDTEAILRIDRNVDEVSGEVVLTISEAGRVRLTNPGSVTIKSKPKGTGYKYLYSAMESMTISSEVIDIAQKVDNKAENDKKQKELDARRDNRKVTDQPMINDIVFVIENLIRDKNSKPVHQKIKHLAKIEASLGGTVVDRLLREYNGVFWEFKPYQDKKGGRRTKKYKLLRSVK